MDGDKFSMKDKEKVNQKSQRTVLLGTGMSETGCQDTEKLSKLTE